MKINRTCLIDADSIVYICAFNKKDSLVEKTLQDCKTSVDDLINNILKHTKATYYLLFLTVGKNFRYEIYPEYKANRKYGEKPKYFDQTKEYLITNYKAIYHPRLESDDLCVIYKKNISNSFLASPDKDIINLEGECFDYKNFKWNNTSKEEANDYFWKSMITGDGVDNIKGIVGKGIKFAESVKQTAELINIPMYTIVLQEYIKSYGEELGIKEFYKNYICLKIIDNYPNLEIKEPIKIENNYELIE